MDRAEDQTQMKEGMNKLEYKAVVIIQNAAQQDEVMDNRRQRLKNMKDRKGSNICPNCSGRRNQEVE